MPYVYKRLFPDTQSGVRKEDDILMLGDSPIMVDTDGDNTMKERVFRGSKRLCDLLTQKNANTEFIIRMT